jgi:hypothetical protein
MARFGSKSHTGGNRPSQLLQANCSLPVYC